MIFYRSKQDAFIVVKENLEVLWIYRNTQTSGRRLAKGQEVVSFYPSIHIWIFKRNTVKTQMTELQMTKKSNSSIVQTS